MFFLFVSQLGHDLPRKISTLGLVVYGVFFGFDPMGFITTLPETSSSPLKIDHWKRRFLFQTTIFRGLLLLVWLETIYGETFFLQHFLKHIEEPGPELSKPPLPQKNTPKRWQKWSACKICHTCASQGRWVCLWRKFRLAWCRKLISEMCSFGAFPFFWAMKKGPKGLKLGWRYGMKCYPVMWGFFRKQFYI